MSNPRIRRVLHVAEKNSVAKGIAPILAGDRKNIRQTSSKEKYCPLYRFNARMRLPGVQNDSYYDHVVTSVRGHLLSLEFANGYNKSWNSVPIDTLFTAPVETYCSTEMKNLEGALMQEAKNVQVLVLWLDCDREGEAIAAEVAKTCKAAKAPDRLPRPVFRSHIPGHYNSRF